MQARGGLNAAGVAEVMTMYRQALREHQAAINRLNVYPVPDGDTGTNMALTLESVVEELGHVEGLEELSESGSTTGTSESDLPPGTPGTNPRAGSELGIPKMAAVCKAIAHGSLMGARGNSGVILSQLLRGATGVLHDKDDVGGREVAAALAAASKAAYEAVLRPVEGTILTVARAAAEGAEGANGTATEGANGAGPDEVPLVRMLESARSSAAEALAQTTDLLPVLAQAGVVDAGGFGYLLLLDSMLAVVDGRPLPEAPAVDQSAAPMAAWAIGGESPFGGGSDDAMGSELVHTGLRYEVMYFLEAPDDTIPAFKEIWEGIGDSIVVVGGEGLWNCHIHTDNVGSAIEAALDVGRPRNIRVSDLAEQMEEERWVRDSAGAPSVQPVAIGPPSRTAVVAVANGEGVGRIFRSLGVHHLVPGGQSMNPSTAQILDVVKAAASDEVVILPNNENIVPVAMQVSDLAEKIVRVVPTGGIVEGFAALLEYDPEAGADENAASMALSARRVVAGEVTRAVRDASGPDGPIRAGDWMGMSRDGIEVVADTIADAACGLLGKLLSDESELVTIIEGDGAGGGETRQITEWLAENHSSLAVEVHHGGQPLYPYLISID